MSITWGGWTRIEGEMNGECSLAALGSTVFLTRHPSGAGVSSAIADDSALIWASERVYADSVIGAGSTSVPGPFYHNDGLYLVAAHPDGHIQSLLVGEVTGPPAAPWEALPDTIVSDMAPSAAFIYPVEGDAYGAGVPALCALVRDATSRTIFASSTPIQPGTAQKIHAWTKWIPAAPGGETDLSPASAGFAGRVHVFVVGPDGVPLGATLRTVSPPEWGAVWSEVPGDFATEHALAATAYYNGARLSLVGTRAADGRVCINTLSQPLIPDTQIEHAVNPKAQFVGSKPDPLPIGAHVIQEPATGWSGWVEVPVLFNDRAGVFTSDGAPAAAVTGNDVLVVVAKLAGRRRITVTHPSCTPSTPATVITTTGTSRSISSCIAAGARPPLCSRSSRRLAGMCLGTASPRSPFRRTRLVAAESPHVLTRSSPRLG